MNRLYIIVRRDLAPGLQMAQACHAALAWTAERAPPENLVVLHADDEAALRALYERCSTFEPALFCEPDLDDEATAFAVDERARTLLSSLPLALRQRAA